MPADELPLFLQARRAFHERACADLIRLSDLGVPSYADKSNNLSAKLGVALGEKLGHASPVGRHPPQTSGAIFEQLVQEYLESCFCRLPHLRPGRWEMARNSSIAKFEQYAHLELLNDAAKENPGLEAILGSDYTIKPDIVVVRNLEPDEAINGEEQLIGAGISTYASLREANGGSSLLHASISCKYSIRSDRSQNSRSEALNLIRNRKGRAPHIVVVTCEPTPSRLGSIALGTGDIDCVYHFALPELVDCVTDLGFEDAADSLNVMIEGKRLRDIGDLPLDLAV